MLVVLHDQDFSPQGYGKDLPGHICNRIAEGHTSGGPSQTDPDPRRDNSGISSHTSGKPAGKACREREGQWSVRINDQWRICFNWQDGHAYNVEIVDYH